MDIFFEVLIQGPIGDLHATWEVNNYIVRSHKDLNVVTNTALRRTNTAKSIVMY